MRTDVELQQEVIRNLRNEVYLTGSRITVFVRRGVVHLHGEVNAPYKQLIALRAVHRTTEVRGVADRLIVTYSSADSLLRKSGLRC